MNLEESLYWSDLSEFIFYLGYVFFSEKKNEIVGEIDDKKVN